MPETVNAPNGSSDTQRRERTRGGTYFQPRVDIFETDSELTLYADVPGVKAEDVELRYERGELVLQACPPRRTRAGLALLREYAEGDYFRVFQIHESIDSEKIEADCKNGVLTVHLPKAETAKPRQVRVKNE
jgi:HSP20 family protein